MNKSYDVYMCRVRVNAVDELAALTEKARELFKLMDTHDKKAVIDALFYPVPVPSLPPFDRMPSKIEMGGMMVIFKREYGE